MPKALPVRRLQLVQWQTPTIVGGAFTVIEAFPQAHVAVIRLPLLNRGRTTRRIASTSDFA